MPELPEVETVARSLAEQLPGRQIVAIERLDWERMVETPSAAEFRVLLPGRQIEAVGRRAKWLLLTLDAGWTLALHLRMSGYLTVVDPQQTADQHTHLVLALDDRRRLFFHDTRKFGRARLLQAAGLAALDAAHGPEPLDNDFTAVRLAERLYGKRGRLKPVLLDQQVIAGLGNIYADEALWHARLHPLRSAETLSDIEIVRLHAAIQIALRDSLERGGSTLRDYRNGYGQPGENQYYFNAYRNGPRDQRPCPRCGGAITRIVVAQRGTHFCATCQQP